MIQILNEILFLLLISQILVGVAIERLVVMRTLSRESGRDIGTALSEQTRLTRLERYKQICESSGRSLIFYHYASILHRGLPWLVVAMIALAVVAFLAA